MKIKRCFLSLKNKIMSKPIVFLVIVLCSILALACFCVSIKELVFRFNYEMQEIGNFDTFLYYTVGRGITQGLKPYADMYENKPPLIFLLSALSLKLTGGFHMVNYFSALSFLVVLVVPIIFVAISLYKNKPNAAIGFIILLFVASSTIMYTIFSEESCGEVQIEIFGSSATILAVLFASFENKRSRLKFLSPFCILSGIFWGIAIMFKEPFVIIVFASILLFTHSRKQLLLKVFFPLCYAVLVCVIVVLLGNCFVPYFTIYINNMFSSHLSIYGSPIERMKNIKILFDYYFIFSPSLALIMFVTFALAILAEVTHTYSKKAKLDIMYKALNAFKVVVCLYLVSFAVGLGGQYYNHHYVFALSFFLSLLMRCCQYAITLGTTKGKQAMNLLSEYQTAKLKQNQPTDKEASVADCEKLSMTIVKAFYIYVIMLLCVMFTCRGFTKTADYVVGTDYVISQTEEMKTQAKYIDEVLDAVGEDRYLWIGFNGYYPYAYTEHLPLGPCFVQDQNNFTTTYGHFSAEFKNQLRSANVVVVPNLFFTIGSVTEYYTKYMSQNFTLATPETVQALDKPLTFNYVIFYRK